MTRHQLALLAVLVLGAYLRFDGLGAKSLWLDEALSWRFTQFSFAELLDRTGDSHTTHPPLYFILLKAWQDVCGDSEIALRSLAAVFGVTAIAATYGFVTQLGQPPARETAVPGDRSQAAALLAATLVALSPLQIHASQQVRGYSLGSALFAASSWALFSALRSCDRAAFRWSLYGLLALLLSYTHHLGLVTVSAQILFMFGYWTSFDRLRRLAIVLTCLAIIACYLPWLSATLGQSEAARTAWQSAPVRFSLVANAIRCAFVGTPSERVTPDPWLDVAIVAPWAASQLLLAVRRSPGDRYLLLTGILPLIFLVTWSYLSPRGIVMARYMTFAQMAWITGIAVMVGNCAFTFERRLLSVWLTSALGLSCYFSWPSLGPTAEPGLRSAVEHILERWAPDERIVVCEPFDFFGVCYYARDRAAIKLLTRGEDRERLRGSSHLKDDELLAADDLATQHIPGVWFITSSSYDSREIVPFIPPSNWRRTDSQNFSRDHFLEQPLKVDHYTINNP